jgi:MoaA/NifB/PqqE/SkfB family radical SAM enzyme
MKVKGFHLELTNKCLLKCSACARTTFINKFGIEKWKNHDLNLDHLKKFLNIDLTDLKFNLCGNLGDPIYYPQLFELLSWLKSKSAVIILVTNGSYKKYEWWTELVSILDSRDTIIFSVDGTPENFINYRVNADWKSIEIGMQVAANSQVNTVWKYIPFSFNEHTVEQARSVATEIGIDSFLISPSDRWQENDPLKPANKDFSGKRTHVIVNWKSDKKNLDINPKCINKRDQHYIAATGHYMPCCYVGDWRFYYASEFYKNQTEFDIANTTISNILNTTEFYSTLSNTKPKYCTFNCPKL